MFREYTKQEGKKLLKLARESIEEEFFDVKLEKLEGDKFQEKSGVFVTLTLFDRLRGCIGFPYAILPLIDAVKEAAKNAAFSDPRFSPLTEHEFKDVKIEISILTKPEKCKEREVKIGEDGLICNYLGYQGLLLPQVAVENNMNKHEFLECLCMKAGLNKDKWKDKNFKLLRFQCQIFSEE